MSKLKKKCIIKGVYIYMFWTNKIVYYKSLSDS